MKKLLINLYDNVYEEIGEWLEVIPFDDNKTCFVKKEQFNGVDCLKFKVDDGYKFEILYFPINRYSIQFVKIIE